MSGESDPGATPVPDPTVLTTEALVRAVQAERDYVDGQIAVLRERLRAIDVATRLLNETVNRVPTDVTKEVAHLRELMDERLQSVGTQFKERDTRSERESRDNKLAVDAAFAAQEKQAKAQNESNTEAIRKSEAATTETIKTNAELSQTNIKAQADKVDDLKDRVIKMESVRQGVVENRGDTRAGRDAGMNVLAAVMVGVSLLIGIGSLLVALRR